MKIKITRKLDYCPVVLVFAMMLASPARALGQPSSKTQATREYSGVRVNRFQAIVIESPTRIAMDRNRNLYVIQSLNDINVLQINLETGFVSPFAGHGGEGDCGDGGPAIVAGLGFPTGLAFDISGNLVIAQLQGKIRRVDSVTRIISTIAGNGKLGDGGSGDGGQGVIASFRRPVDLAFDSHGNLFVADDLNQRIRRIDAVSGIITTFVGGGNAGLGDGGPASKATLKFPSAIAFDSQDNLYIADFGNHRIRRVDAKTGIVTTEAGTGDERVGQKTGSAKVVNLKYPRNIALDGEGNIFVNGGWGHTILRINTKTGMVSEYVGTGIAGFSGDGKLATRARINAPSGMIIDQSGNLFFSDNGNNRVRRVDAKSKIITSVPNDFR